MNKEPELFLARQAGGERALLVHIDFLRADLVGDLSEFRELVRSAGLEIVDEIVGKRSLPDAKYFIGKGKAEQIRQQIPLVEAQVVLVDHNLSAAQGRNLETLFCCRVIDRTELILDIFAQRARSFEGKLQVELAQLQHLSSRLIRGWLHLERQKGGIGLRGPGETQLETDRRLIGVRIKHIKKRLEKVSKQRAQSRRSRKRATRPTISLVGYTNAGKSSLFNYLTDSKIYAADQLFATLDPTFRQIKIPQVGHAILADTVGFIRHLPHDLVVAFHATLEETVQADLLLHVIDASHPDKMQQINEVNKVLAEIGADKVPCLHVYNKIDLLESFTARLDYDRYSIPQRVCLSAISGEGIELLIEAITALLSEQVINTTVTLNPQQAKLRAQLYELDVVKTEEMNENGQWILTLQMRLEDYQKLFP